MIITKMIKMGQSEFQNPFMQQLSNEPKCKLFCNNDFYLRENLIKNFTHAIALRTRPESVSRKWPIKFTLQDVVKTPGFKTCDTAKFGQGPLSLNLVKAKEYTGHFSVFLTILPCTTFDGF